jgi:hypothetical protein
VLLLKIIGKHFILPEMAGVCGSIAPLFGKLIRFIFLNSWILQNYQSIVQAVGGTRYFLRKELLPKYLLASKNFLGKGILHGGITESVGFRKKSIFLPTGKTK